MKDLLATIQDKIALLKPLANEAQKGTLDKINDLAAQVNDFQKNVSFLGKLSVMIYSGFCKLIDI